MTAVSNFWGNKPQSDPMFNHNKTPYGDSSPLS